MKIWTKGIVILALVALLGCSLFACGGGASGPEAAVEGVLKAFGAEDAEKVASYFPEDEREEVIAMLEFSFGFVENLKVSNIETRLVSETGNTATVDAEWDITGTILGEEDTDHVEDTMKLEKIDGKWLIVESGLLE